MLQNKAKDKFSKTGKLFLYETLNHITKSLPQVIIEYNAGSGYITREVLPKMHPYSIIYAFERDIEKCKTLCEIMDMRLRVRNLPAEEVSKIMYYEETVDCIISSVPFLYENDDTVTKIIIDSYKLLKNEGFMIQVLNSKAYFPLYEKYFRFCSLKVSLCNTVFWIGICQKKLI